MFLLASSASWLGVVVLVELLVFSEMVAAGIQHNVGDKAGWKLPSLAKINYTDWASQYSFRVEDTLHFRYDQRTESVLQVSLADFDSCSNSTPLATYDDGDTVVYLLRDGCYWFICGNPIHCRAGQKFSIRVQPFNHASYRRDATAQPPTSTDFRGSSTRAVPVAAIPAPPSSSSALILATSSAIYVLLAALVA